MKTAIWMFLVLLVGLPLFGQNSSSPQTQYWNNCSYYAYRAIAAQDGGACLQGCTVLWTQQSSAWSRTYNIWCVDQNNNTTYGNENVTSNGTEYSVCNTSESCAVMQCTPTFGVDTFKGEEPGSYNTLTTIAQNFTVDSSSTPSAIVCDFKNGQTLSYHCSAVGCVYCPIVVDTTGEGFRLTSADAGVMFDLRGDGHAVKIAWTAAGSGNAWLALDRNHDGRIDNGTELFGNYTPQSPSDNPNGFLALAEFDKPKNGGNGDGIIDSEDAVFSHLLLWIDENHDGISQPNELHTLPELGIYSFSLKYTRSEHKDQYGNVFHYKGVVDPEGDPLHVDRTMWDVFLTSE